MGAGNAKLAYHVWRDLPDGPLRVLVYMALISMDDDDPPKFWGGRETLALATGRIVADKWTEDPGELAERRRAFKAVERTLKLLRDAGAIWQISAAHTGRQAVYGLNLKSPRSSGGQWPESPRTTGGQSTEETPTHRGAVNGRVAPTTTLPAERPPLSGQRDPHSVGQRPPLSGRETPAEWGSEEYKDLRNEKGQEHTAAPLSNSEDQKTETPTSLPPVGASPFGRRGTSRAEQSIAEASMRRAVRIVAEHTGATADEAAAAVALIRFEKNPVSLVPFVQRLANDGDVAAYVARIRDGGRQESQQRAADAWWNN